MSNTNETSNGNGNRKWAIKPDISLGNILTIASILVAFAIAWGRMDSRVASMSRDIMATEAAAKEHCRDDTIHYMVASPAEVRLAEIKELVTKIDTKLDAHINQGK
jgi:hypothetical protein